MSATIRDAHADNWPCRNSAMNNRAYEVVVASKNPVKINAVSIGFEKLLDTEQLTFKGVSTESGVPDQPKRFVAL